MLAIQAEVAGLRSASVKDSLAICSYFCWLEAFLKDPAAAPPPPAVPKTAAAFQPKPLASDFVLCLPMGIPFESSALFMECSVLAQQSKTKLMRSAAEKII